MTISEIRPNTPPPQQAKNPGQPRAADTAQNSAGEGADVFNAAETEYFATLYPQAASEIRSYATYRKEGEASPAVLGSRIDRKG
jgi:hypothetical protein